MGRASAHTPRPGHEGGPREDEPGPGWRRGQAPPGPGTARPGLRPAGPGRGSARPARGLGGLPLARAGPPPAPLGAGPAQGRRPGRRGPRCRGRPARAPPPRPRAAMALGGGCTHLHGRHSLGHFPAQRRLLVADLLRGQRLGPAPAPAVQPQALDAQLLRLRPC